MIAADGPVVPDLGLAPNAEGRPKSPTAQHFVAPLLHILGEATRYHHRVFIDAGRNSDREQVHNELLDTVLRAAGFDPYSPASLPAPGLFGRTPDGLYKLIWYALRNNAESNPRPGKKFKPLFVIHKEKGKPDSWALNERGVAAAVNIRELFATDSRNVTAIWLDGQIANGLYDKLHHALLYNPKLAKERAADEITDHLHTFIATSIRRDAFRSWLLRGDAPTVRQMSEWAIRKSISAFRRYSQDSLHRTMRGALTSSERKGDKHTVSVAAMQPTTFQTVIQDYDDNEPVQEQRTIVDTEATQRQLHDMAWDEGLDRVRDAIRRHKPGAADRYVRIFDLMCQGYSVEEVGNLANTSAEREAELRAQGMDFRQILLHEQANGVSRNRAASIMADCRAAIRQAAQAAKDARTLLLFLQDEPYATLDDIKAAHAGAEGFDALKVSSDLDWLVDELVQRGRIHRQDDGAHFVTDLGEAYLTEWDVQDRQSADAAKNGVEFTGDFGHRVSL